MTRKIAKTLHLTKGQWKTLDSLMKQPIASTPDDSVRRVCEIVRQVAGESGVELADSEITTTRLPCRYDSNPETDSCSAAERRACTQGCRS